MHKNKKCKIVNLRSLSFVTTARGMALVTSKGLRQLKKKSKSLPFIPPKKQMWVGRCGGRGVKKKFFFIFFNQ